MERYISRLALNTPAYNLTLPMATHIPVVVMILGAEPFAIYGMRASDGPSVEEILDRAVKYYLAETDTEDGFTWGDAGEIEMKYWQAAGLFLPTIIREPVTKLADEQLAEPDDRDVPDGRRPAPLPRDE